MITSWMLNDLPEFCREIIEALSKKAARIKEMMVNSTGKDNREGQRVETSCLLNESDEVFIFSPGEGNGRPAEDPL
jgi:hypothetical protein